MSRSRFPGGAGFTLVELLVVIAIIPTFRKSRLGFLSNLS
ncbi:MAG: prepilin-type N-terminal cleavage/methylation domain-containing protein [Planctomycetota bacterium]|nr:prepilin-type N-terminal cleavage/methylation domain-containing protein [Planctomycetota bacterium]